MHYNGLFIPCSPILRLASFPLQCPFDTSVSSVSPPGNIGSMRLDNELLENMSQFSKFHMIQRKPAVYVLCGLVSLLIPFFQQDIKLLIRSSLPIL